MSSGSLFQQFKMDKEKEKNGVKVFPAGPNPDGTIPSFTLARMGPMNQKYQKTLERITQPYQRQITLKTLPNDKAEALMMEVFVNSILLSWENVQDENCVIIPFSAENAINLFKQMMDLYFELQQQAQSAALFRIEQSEQLAGN